ncbi:hypothetical protein ACLOJK_026964 [Asimina triloba]
MYDSFTVDELVDFPYGEVDLGEAQNLRSWLNDLQICELDLYIQPIVIHHSSLQGCRPIGCRRRLPHGVFEVVSFIHLLRSVAIDAHEFTTNDVIGDVGVVTAVNQVEGASGEEEEEVSNAGVVVELADCLGEHGPTKLAFLSEAACLGEPVVVVGEAIPEVNIVHHSITVEEVVADGQPKQGIGVVADVDATKAEGMCPIIGRSCLMRCSSTVVKLLDIWMLRSTGLTQKYLIVIG